VAKVGQLRVRKLADRSAGDEAPYPFAGLVVEAKPKRCQLPTQWVAQGLAEGWIETEGMRVEHRPGGPVDDQWATTHSFVHYDAIVLKAIDGDVRYRVTRQPDKYVDSKDPDATVTPEIYAAGETRVDWFYDCDLEA
jgi:hypothetical protein